MSQKCAVTGRGPQIGNRISHAHNVSKRRFNINLQNVRVLVNGQVKTIKVSTKAIKSGLIVKPPIKLRAPRVKPQRPVTVGQEPILLNEEPQEVRFFSESSVVTRLFKPKPQAAVEAAASESSPETESAAAAPELNEEVNIVDAVTISDEQAKKMGLEEGNAPKDA